MSVSTQPRPTEQPERPSYPVRVDARLEPRLSRWLWLVKWVLVIPHYVVLVFLWVAFLVTTAVAFFGILFTGRYPRSIFDFNVGVLRWSWRVAYYAYGGLGTDQYPPFTLEDRPDYPARLDVSYPEHLSRGLVLVKWWLLAIPHYLVIAFLAGGGWYVAGAAGDGARGVWNGGLIELLVVVAAVVLLFTGRYPRGLFDLILGLNRWVIRVAAYASLMTDAYPPFRLDQGGADPGSGHLLVADRREPPVTSSTPVVSRDGGLGPSGGVPPSPTRPWGAGRVITLVVGCTLLLVSGVMIIGGVGLFVVDSVLRDDDGFVTSSPVEVSSPGHAVLTQDLTIHDNSSTIDLPERLIGTIRVTARSNDGPVFVGIADRDDVSAYLQDVARSTVLDPLGEEGRPTYDFTDGGAPASDPGSVDIWIASARGAGSQTIELDPQEGDWVLVVMNADATAPVAADVEVGATLPLLDEAMLVLILAGLVGEAAAAALLWAALRRPAPERLSEVGAR